MIWDNDRAAFMVKETATHYIDLVPMIYNVRVVMTPKDAPLGYDAGWCYPGLLEAAAAVEAWDPDTQHRPEGFIKEAAARQERY